MAKQSNPRRLGCQECGGAGSYIEPVLDYGEGPSYTCGWCEGKGHMTPEQRGLWLACKRQDKREKEGLLDGE